MKFTVLHKTLKNWAYRFLLLKNPEEQNMFNITLTGFQTLSMTLLLPIISILSCSHVETSVRTLLWLNPLFRYLHYGPIKIQEGGMDWLYTWTISKAYWLKILLNIPFFNSILRLTYEEQQSQDFNRKTMCSFTIFS